MKARYLTVPAASEYSGKHPVTIRRALEAGQLHGSQMVPKGRWSIHTDCLEQWLAGDPCAHQLRSAS